MSEAQKVLLVTGGSRGIGAAICRLAASAGYRVAVNYAANRRPPTRSSPRSRRPAARLSPSRATSAARPISWPCSRRSTALRPARCLVNNAGIVDVKARVDEMSAARLERMMRINVVGSILCAREAVKRMSTPPWRQGRRDRQHVVGGGGSSARRATMSTMPPPRARSTRFTIGLAREVATEGIRVNAVRPGIIDTEIHASGGQPDRVAQMRDVLPMKRAGTADEVASAVLYLLSDAASYTTGAILNVSGGR